MQNESTITGKVSCPLCNDFVDRLLYRFHLDSEQVVIDKIKEDHPVWTQNDGACSRCLDYYQVEIIQQQRILPDIGPYFSVKSLDDFVILPTGLRVDAHPRFTAKGITICFIDSGFYAHADLITKQDRIIKFVDITRDNVSHLPGSDEPDTSSWHGTMTTVVCAGDGYLSNGLYKGIASDAKLILLKVQDADGRITTSNIVKALRWIKEHHHLYNIRVVNMSVSDDLVSSYKESEVDKLAEVLIAEGVTIVAAVGNDENGKIHPPANSLNVIAVGGIDDNNTLDGGLISRYHSSFGVTIDALQKPELVSHAIWIAAPILPGTKQQREATVLYDLLATEKNQLRDKIRDKIIETELEKTLINETNTDVLINALTQRIQLCKYISPHYMHVDGTSFAAPIVSAVIAQLLEINPALTTAMIREILFSTAKRIQNIPAIQQGFGVMQPRKAILKILKREHYIKNNKSPFVNKEKNTVEFYINNDCAEQISLAGSFNNWAQDVLLMEPSRNGLWSIELPLLNKGKYTYKFFVDSKEWVADVDNPYREPDGFNGFNSVLIIQN